MKPQHVGMVVDNDLIADVRVLNEALFLRSKGWRVSVLCFDHGNKQRQEYDQLDLEVHFFKKSLWWKNKFRALMTWLPVYERAWRKRVTKFYEEAKFDIIHVHDLYMSKTVDRDRVPVPMVLDLHELYPAVVFDYQWASKMPNRLFVLPELWRIKEESYVKHADGVIVLSEHFKRSIIERFNIERNVIVYPNVPNIQVFENANSKKRISELEKIKGKFTLFYFGQSAIRRGIFTLLDAIESIESSIDIHLLIIGPIEKADKAQVLSKINAGVNLPYRISWIPWVKLSELPNYIDCADVCLSPRLNLPQYDCGVPNKVYQYMLFDKPLIVSNSTAQMELVEKYDCGLVYKAGDAESLKNCIIYATLNRDIMKEKGLKGGQAIHEYLNTDIKGEEILYLYKELLKQTNTKSQVAIDPNLGNWR